MLLVRSYVIRTNIIRRPTTLSNASYVHSQNRRLPTLTLFTKHPCPLWDEAKENLKPFEHRYHLEQVDISLPDYKKYFDKYKYDIPVFHFNGEFLMKHRADLELVEKTLIEYEKQS
ncbi:hypothetical protein SNE40_011928 [Patella caerulea]|uniref:Glutaredoxin-like protein n=1 Tax=Patella caerulea TaxID=87958 RepID=A0AAN8PME8_PATCE